MKVLAINGSPKKEGSNTNLILKPFLEGMQQEGASVELLYTYDLAINFCRGGCISTHNQSCTQKDDMQLLYEKLYQSDIWVFATPVYADGVTASLKNIMDRMAPLLDKQFVLHNGKSRHGTNVDRMSKVVLVANCGFWGMENFDPLLAHFRAFCENGSRQLNCALLRPHGTILRLLSERASDRVSDIFDAAREGGRQMITQGTVDSSVIAAVKRELLSLDEFIEKSNRLLKTKYMNNAY
jgi:NAD(P)H-dependent FMN reductase